MRGLQRTLWAVTVAGLFLLPQASALAQYDMEPDSQIKQRVLGKLQGVVRLDLRDLKVAVSNGLVTLDGSVASIGQKYTVNRIIGNTYGVTGIVNNLTVRPAAKPDSALVREIKEGLMRRPRFRDPEIQVMVAGGLATLTGTVARAGDRYDAEQIAASVAGVTGVDNRLLIASAGAVPPEVLETRVLGVLSNQLTFGSIRELGVEVSGSEVTLTGVAVHPGDRVQAEQLAMRVPGVTVIINRIRVAGS